MESEAQVIEKFESTHLKQQVSSEFWSMISRRIWLNGINENHLELWRSFILYATQIESVGFDGLAQIIKNFDLTPQQCYAYVTALFKILPLEQINGLYCYHLSNHHPLGLMAKEIKQILDGEAWETEVNFEQKPFTGISKKMIMEFMDQCIAFDPYFQTEILTGRHASRMLQFIHDGDEGEALDNIIYYGKVCQYYGDQRWLDIKDKNGDAFLQYAISVGASEKIIEALITIGVDVNVLHNVIQSPKYAIEKKASIIKLLLQKNKSIIEQKDSENYTPLMRAVEKGAFALVNILIENGAKPAITSNEKKKVTALTIAKKSNGADKKKIVQLLEKSVEKETPSKNKNIIFSFFKPKPKSDEPPQLRRTKSFSAMLFSSSKKESMKHGSDTKIPAKIPENAVQVMMLLAKEMSENPDGASNTPK